MLFTKSLEKRRNEASGTIIRMTGKAVAERKCAGVEGYMAGPYSKKRVQPVTLYLLPNTKSPQSLRIGETGNMAENWTGISLWVLGDRVPEIALAAKAH